MPCCADHSLLLERVIEVIKYYTIDSDCDLRPATALSSLCFGLFYVLST
jgi:hypothetical protein